MLDLGVMESQSVLFVMMKYDKYQKFKIKYKNMIKIMRIKSIVVLASLIGVVFTSCKKERPESIQAEVINDNVKVFATSAVFTWTVDFPGKIFSVVEVSENEDMTAAKRFGDEDLTECKTFIVNVEGLLPATTYYYRYVIWNPYYVDNPFIIEKKQFSTLMNLPKVSTSEVTGVTRTTAYGGGIVIDDGGASVTERGVCWNVQHDPTIENSSVMSESSVGDYTVQMTALEGGVTYYVRAFAINAAGIGYGNEVSFTTVPPVLPEVTTGQVTNVSAIFALGNGVVVSDGGAVTERGFCWSTHSSPTIDDNSCNNGTGTGVFAVVMTGLSANTTYWAKAYAKNKVGTVYGDELTFNTTSSVPTGSINGVFSVSETKQVYFSKGNLQFKASSNTWRFAERQYDYVGGTNRFGISYGNVGSSSNNSISSTYSGWIDLFGWGTSGYNHGAVCYQPWSTNADFNEDQDKYYAYGKMLKHLFDAKEDGTMRGQADWGYNAISNGGNINNRWRTLTADEWDYVFNQRTGNRFLKAIVSGVKGVIILPDDWTLSIYSLKSINDDKVDYNENCISAIDWTNILEASGAVFLPKAGNREWTEYDYGNGYYWSSSSNGSLWAKDLFFNGASISAGTGSGMARYLGASVRLVRDVE